MQHRSWFLQLAVVFSKFFSLNSRKAILIQELEVENQRIKQLRLKAKKEIKYLNRFTHWPMAKTKPKNIEEPLIYLQSHDKKRANGDDFSNQPQSETSHNHNSNRTKKPKLITPHFNKAMKKSSSL